RSVRLYGDKGGFEIDPEIVLVSEQSDTIVNTYPQTDHKEFEFNSAFQNEINHFASSISTGSTPISPVQDGVTIMKILGAIYESAAKGEEVKL
ncbi:Gfo/Idh/MocA family oxidoreductase, partial [Paenibacillus sp.]|uniref:Gfo/Idh/MocA family oxidoreductase n=1 Tax=Paenibacillus sp. TaxID=58172 RepID=UPI0028A9F53A